ncbi:MAG TPA: hypothetical protein VFC46_10620 [Humisphaera sp.]|nr:hypothetical protein [Humisphaera sp.]
MGKLWMKIWIWIKVIVFACLAIYALAFIHYNHETTSNFWYWWGPQGITTSLELAFFSFLAGVIATLLVRTTIKTIRQIRDVQDRNRHEKMQRDVEDMKAKAGMLRAKPADEKTSQT